MFNGDKFRIMYNGEIFRIIHNLDRIRVMLVVLLLNSSISILVLRCLDLVFMLSRTEM